MSITSKFLFAVLAWSGSSLLVQGPIWGDEIPPPAKIYPALPDMQEAFFIPGFVVRHSRDRADAVTCEVSATADVEYSGATLRLVARNDMFRFEGVEVLLGHVESRIERSPSPLSPGWEDIVLEVEGIGDARLAAEGEEVIIAILSFTLLGEPIPGQLPLHCFAYYDDQDVLHSSTITVRHLDQDGAVTRSEVSSGTYSDGGSVVHEPLAEVYPEAPSTEAVGLRVETEAFWRSQSDVDFDVRVYATAAVEYPEIEIPIRIPIEIAEFKGAWNEKEGWLEFRCDWVPENSPDPVTAVIIHVRDFEGSRMAAAGERYNVANLLCRARDWDIDRDAIRCGFAVEPVIDGQGALREPRIGVRHLDGAGGEVTSPISPVSIGSDCLEIRPMCPDTYQYPVVTTDAFSFQAETVSGAPGDVVGVTISLRSGLVPPEEMGISWLSIVLCHDPAVADLEGEPLYTPDLLSMVGLSGIIFCPVDERVTSPLPSRGFGFIQYISVDMAAYRKMFPSDVPIPLETVYYRLKGAPGDQGAISFCTGAIEFREQVCNFPFIQQYDGEGWHIRNISSSNADGSLLVVEGPVTRPDRPPEPPDAKIYTEISAEDVNFRVEVGGATASPGSRDVPIDVYVSSDVEYTSIVIPIDYDERYLRLTRGEDSFIGGIVLVRNETGGSDPSRPEGWGCIFSGMGVSQTRLALEGERIHAATLYFDVLEAAAEISSTDLTIPTTFPGYPPWIGVRTAQGTGTYPEVVRSEVGPFVITNGRMRILPEITLFIRGDSDDNGVVDVTDPIATFSFLFLGGRAPSCPAAADANDDGQVDIADAIATLEVLFLGGKPLPPPFPELGKPILPAALPCRGR